jgi:hypothetical protein
MAGYSGTPLPQKLGIKPGTTVAAINVPSNYRKLLGKLPSGVTFANRIRAGSNFIHFFTKSRAELAKELSSLRKKIAENGVVWISWPKKSSGVPTDITEDVIRDIALPIGFVDIKVCAVDDTWSGLKLMIRKTNRKIPSPQSPQRSARSRSRGGRQSRLVRVFSPNENATIGSH